MKRIGIFGNKKGTSADEHDDDDDDDVHDNADPDQQLHHRHSDDAGDAWNPSHASALPNPSSNRKNVTSGATTTNSNAATAAAAVSTRPNYRGVGTASNQNRTTATTTNDEDDENVMTPNHNVNFASPESLLGHEEDDDEEEEEEDYLQQLHKAEHIEKSAGTSRLNRILRDTTVAAAASAAVGSTNSTTNTDRRGMVPPQGWGTGSNPPWSTTTTHSSIDKVSNPRNVEEVGHFVGRVVVPPLRIDATTIGGRMLEKYPDSMVQECLYAGSCTIFESTGNDTVHMPSLQYPNEYGTRKRSLGLFTTTTTSSTGAITTTTTAIAAASSTMHKGRMNKARYVMVARSTNRPLLPATQKRQLEFLQQKQLQQQQQQLLMLSTQEQQNVVQRSTFHASSNAAVAAASDKNSTTTKKQLLDESDREDYDTMFAPDPMNDDTEDDDDDDTSSRDVSVNSSDTTDNIIIPTSTTKREETTRKSGNIAAADPAVPTFGSDEAMGKKKSHSVTTTAVSTSQAAAMLQLEKTEEEISSFPVLICMTLQNDGTSPDIRKLVPLDQLTTVQDLNSTVVQLAFSNGDTIRIDFGTNSNNNHISNTDDDGNFDRKGIMMERSLDKERFIWSLLQIHAMLCSSVVERNSNGTIFLPPLNVRNLDRAELQYVASINGFVKNDETLRTLLERQRKIIEENETSIMMIHHTQSSGRTNIKGSGEEKLSSERYDMDDMTYDLMMGNFATRVTLFHSEDERKDAEEILNSTEWTDLLDGTSGGGTSSNSEEITAVNVAERLSKMLQGRMRDLEAETCRRLIAWEDEKHISVSDRTRLHDVSDARDTVDALALASLFKTLESLDSELKAMEDWLQDRAAAIKPLTDDCADIEEENRQLEQQWKSYDTLGSEMRRLLHGQELDETTEGILKNPASVLFYSEDGLVNVEDSEDGIERIYEAGKALLDAIEFVRPPKIVGVLRSSLFIAYQIELISLTVPCLLGLLFHCVILYLPVKIA
jgi:hypothetical protein